MLARLAALLDEAVVVFVWVPGLAFCPVKAPWGETSAEIAFGKAVKRPETV